MATKSKTHTEPTLGPQTLSAWRERMGYSQRDACTVLGCSRGAWAGWESGEHTIPRYIGLALAALALGMKTYSEDQHKLNGDPE